MHEVAAEVQEETPSLSLERMLEWARRNCGVLLLVAVVLTAAVLLARPSAQNAEVEVDVAPDETPLFV